MKIDVIGDGYEVDEKLKTLILKKLQRLNKYFEPSAVCKLILRQEKTAYVMSVNIFGEKQVRAEAQSMNMYDNIDIIIPKITRQIRKQQGKIESIKDGTIPKILFNNDLKDAAESDDTV